MFMINLILSKFDLWYLNWCFKVLSFCLNVEVSRFITKIPRFVNKCNICSTYNFMSWRIIMQHNYVNSPTSFKCVCWMNKCAGYNGIHYLYKKEGSGWSNVKVFCLCFAMLLLDAKIVAAAPNIFFELLQKIEFHAPFKIDHCCSNNVHQQDSFV